MTTAALLAIVAGTAIAGLVAGLSGFAFGMVALSIWIWVLDPVLLAPMVVFGSLVGQLIGLGAVRRAFDLRRILPFLIGGGLGVPIGVALLDHIDIGMFRATVGIVLILYCSFILFISGSPVITTGGRAADSGIGLVGGVMGGLAGLSGPVPTLWCSLRGWTKDVQRSTFQSFNLAIHVMALTGYAVSGVLTATTLKVFALMLPTILLPSWLGTRLYRRIDEIAFRRMILVLLLLSGIVLLGSSVLR